jgi:hypothetical protein
VLCASVNKFFFAIYVVFMRKYCDRKDNQSLHFMDLHIFGIPEYEQVDFGMPSVCMCVRACSRILCWCLNAWTDFVHIQYLGVIHYRLMFSDGERPLSNICIYSQWHTPNKNMYCNFRNCFCCSE